MSKVRALRVTAPHTSRGFGPAVPLRRYPSSKDPSPQPAPAPNAARCARDPPACTDSSALPPTRNNRCVRAPTPNGRAAASSVCSAPGLRRDEPHCVHTADRETRHKSAALASAAKPGPGAMRMQGPGGDRTGGDAKALSLPPPPSPPERDGPQRVQAEDQEPRLNSPAPALATSLEPSAARGEGPRGGRTGGDAALQAHSPSPAGERPARIRDGRATRKTRSERVNRSSPPSCRSATRTKLWEMKRRRRGLRNPTTLMARAPGRNPPRNPRDLLAPAGRCRRVTSRTRGGSRWNRRRGKRRRP